MGDTLVLFIGQDTFHRSAAPCILAAQSWNAFRSKLLSNGRDGFPAHKKVVGSSVVDHPRAPQRRPAALRHDDLGRAEDQCRAARRAAHGGAGGPSGGRKGAQPLAVHPRHAEPSAAHAVVVQEHVAADRAGAAGKARDRAHPAPHLHHAAL